MWHCVRNPHLAQNELENLYSTDHNHPEPLALTAPGQHSLVTTCDMERWAGRADMSLGQEMAHEFLRGSADLACYSTLQ